jgi:hypothetical protein
MVQRNWRTGRGHHSEEEWLDFVRGQAAQPPALEKHLAGCSSCAATVGFWKSVLDKAGAEAGYAPPDSAVRQARGSFAFARPKGLAARALEAASLVFDSFRQPQPAGVRAAGESPRQMLYQAGPYVVRLRVEPPGDSDRVSIVGQVLDDTNPSRTLADLSVLALHGQETIDRTLTNQLGEFQLEPEAVDNLRLCVGVPDRGPLTVGLLLRTRSSRTDARAHGGPVHATGKARRPSRTRRPRR